MKHNHYRGSTIPVAANHNQSDRRLQLVTEHLDVEETCNQIPDPTLNHGERSEEPKINSEESSDRYPTSQDQTKQPTFFSLSPVEDALLREVFSGRFTV